MGAPDNFLLYRIYIKEFFKTINSAKRSDILILGYDGKIKFIHKPDGIITRKVVFGHSLGTVFFEVILEQEKLLVLNKMKNIVNYNSLYRLLSMYE